MRRSAVQTCTQLSVHERTRHRATTMRTGRDSDSISRRPAIDVAPAPRRRVLRTTRGQRTHARTHGTGTGDVPARRAPRPRLDIRRSREPTRRGCLPGIHQHARTAALKSATHRDSEHGASGGVPLPTSTTVLSVPRRTLERTRRRLDVSASRDRRLRGVSRDDQHGGAVNARDSTHRRVEAPPI